MIYDEATPFRSEYNAGADIVMSTSPLLSIITPMYNAGSMFDEFMQSLLAQTLTLLEIIIVDDGSTDGSGERADQYAQQHS
ncbi:MAG TPA: glycosyltransferase, partial [Pantoea agglomerans]|nr:glycosyltransferase [Pantoea agglomerans]